MNRNIFYKLIFITFAVFIITGCYQMTGSDSGSISLNATLPAKAGDSEEVWVVCIVVDAAFEDDMIDMMRLYDKSDYYDDQGNDALSDQYEDEADEFLEDMLTKGAVRFDGGRFFYQFRMDYGGGDSGEFVVPGIPADKDYFLYVLVFDREITSIDDMEDADADVYMEMHYYDESYYTGDNGGDLDGFASGWYYFTDWDTDYSDINNPAYTSATAWYNGGSSPVSNQPFTVEPGDGTSLDILLIEEVEMPMAM